jgi:hypothetical protein
MRMTRTIELQDVGPLHHLLIPLPDEGGLVVLRGLNGTGKTHALAAVSALVGSAKKPPSRDGSLGAQITGLGVRLTVGRRSSTSGELEVAALDGEDPSLLVDPGLKSADAADAERVRALLRLSRSSVDASAFAHLVGGDERLRELCRASSLEPRGDIPAMAAAIKRDLEGTARKYEQAAENLRAKAAGVTATLEELGGGDAEPPFEHATVEDALAAHNAAIRAHAALEATQSERRKRRAAGQQAEAALEHLGDDGNQASITAAQEALRAAEQTAQEAFAAVEAKRHELERAKQALADAKATFEQAQDREAVAGNAVKRQQRQAEQRAALERAIDVARDAGDVSIDELNAAVDKVERAREQTERWAMRQRTEGVRQDIARLEKEANEIACQGADLREAAAGTERVLLEAVRAVCGDDMELTEGRLYVRSDRGRELFGDLSMGERWRRSLDIAVKAVGRSGLLVVRQEAFESLDPPNREAVAQYARELKVVVLTAEASDGEIRAEQQQ